MLPVSYSDSHERIIRAGWVVVSSSEIIQNGYVRTRNGKIIETGSFSGLSAGMPEVVDLGPGIIFPGLINCHTHLELSFLKGRLETSKGFREWVQNLIVIRSGTSEDEMIKAARESLSDAHYSGTVFVADISTLGLSPQIFAGLQMPGIGFHEFLDSLKSGTSLIPFPGNSTQSYSFAAHAPHTTSPDLMCFLKKETLKQNLPFSIHLDESDDEREFIKKGKGAWAEFLLSRGIDYSAWPIPSESPVAYAEKTGILDSSTLCVHLCGSNEKDLDIIRKRDAKVCLCPRSNMNLHGILPDVGKMISKGIKPCIGTDSLASVGSLSVLDEIRFLSEKFPGIDSVTLFEMATLNGASALGVAHSFGALEPGKSAFMIYYDHKVLSGSEVFDVFV